MEPHAAYRALKPQLSDDAILSTVLLRNFIRMARIRTYGKWLAALLILFVLAQIGLFYIFGTGRMRAYLLAHLEKSFGRPVEARSFSMELLPFPRIDVEGVSIGENPSFGNEYFLRADRLTASVRWLGLLQGHFDFGTISLSRPSLILVRNEMGRWNLEGWLPPAVPKFQSSNANYGPQRPVEPANHLQKIEFDEGRINFKNGDEKRPFSFIEVSGSVEQMGPGRWQLRLEAQPWRSGVALQSTGTLQIRGEVAGTSSRLQPAQLQVHWGRVSIADLFRMISGNDYGARGELTLDGNASVGKSDSGDAATPGTWKFDLHAYASKIHRWDLTERSDNPQLSLSLKGRWDLATEEAHADSATLDLPHSHFEGAATLKTNGMSEWNLRVEHAGLQAQDLLAWYRAFRPDVAETVSVSQFYQARFALHGLPVSWEDAQISANSGELRLPGFAKPLRIGEVQGAVRGNIFELQPVLILIDAPVNEVPSKSEQSAAKVSPAGVLAPLELRIHDDFAAGKGSLNLGGKLEDVGSFFKAAAALGKTLNHGWELTGGASGVITRDWDQGVLNGLWSGSVLFSKAQLQAAGLNLPLKLDEVRIESKNGRRNATITRADAFGATWSGSVTENLQVNDSTERNWKFQLHADHLDAADLDLWFGPRARPNWLQRLLPSLLGKSDASAKPSELLRRVSAEGNLTADSLSVEKIRLARARAHLVFHDLHLDVTEASAEWAGGTAQGSVKAEFSVPPQYEISAELDRVNLAQFPWSAQWADRWSGTAAGKIRLSTSGIGRDALTSQLVGAGSLHLVGIELHGWDVSSSLDSGALHTGSSRWASGEGKFTIQDRAMKFDTLVLQNPREKIELTGTIDFSQDVRLTFASAPTEKRSPKIAPVARTLELRGPLANPVAAIESGPGSQAREK